MFCCQIYAFGKGNLQMSCGFLPFLLLLIMYRFRNCALIQLFHYHCLTCNCYVFGVSYLQLCMAEISSFFQVCIRYIKKSSYINFYGTFNFTGKKTLFNYICIVIYRIRLLNNVPFCSLWKIIVMWCPEDGFVKAETSAIEKWKFLFP